MGIAEIPDTMSQNNAIRKETQTNPGIEPGKH